MRLSNDTYISFCNAVNELQLHLTQCPQCAEYVSTGDGDLCAKSKTAIAKEMAFVDTNVVPAES